LVEHPFDLQNSKSVQREEDKVSKEKRVPYIEKLREEKHPPVITRAEVRKYFELHEKIAKRIKFVYKGLMGKSNVEAPVDCQSVERAPLYWRGYDPLVKPLEGVRVLDREVGYEPYCDVPTIKEVAALIPMDYLWDENWIDTELARREEEKKEYERFRREEEKKRAKELEESEVEEYSRVKRRATYLRKKLIKKGKIKE
jgi:hypothetical protein